MRVTFTDQETLTAQGWCQDSLTPMCANCSGTTFQVSWSNFSRVKVYQDWRVPVYHKVGYNAEKSLASKCIYIRQAKGPWANISLPSKAYVTPRTFCLQDAFCSHVPDFVRNLHTHKNQSRFNLQGCMSTLSQFGVCMSTLSQFGLASWLPAIAVCRGWEEKMSLTGLDANTITIGSYLPGIAVH